MNALEALHGRSSVPRLTEPAPSQAILENIFKAAFRAADHGLLKPWRFLSISGDSRNRLGELFAAASQSDDKDISQERLDIIRHKPLRAPLLVVTIVSFKDHPKVPRCEQEYSAACATQNMLVAAHALGVGAMWRTGSMAYHPVVMRGLGLESREKIIGFLYLGTAAGPRKAVSLPEVEAFFQEW